jgi:hypothetical protein
MTTWSPAAIEKLPRVACIPTLPSRAATFELVLRRIAPQCDVVHVYLDGHDHVPAVVQETPNARAHFCADQGGLHSASRFLVLETLAEPSIVVSVDDDIEYPANYVSEIVAGLARVNGTAVVGYHANIYLPPHVSYLVHRVCFLFENPVDADRYVHDVGCGTCAFVSSVLSFDVKSWRGHGLEDILLAIEAQKRGLSRIVLRREAGFLKGYAKNQSDSLWAMAQKDDSAHSAAMRRLLGMYRRSSDG